MSRPVSINVLNVSNVSFAVGKAVAGRNPTITLKYDGQNLQIKCPRIGYPGGCLVRTNDTGVTTHTLIGTLKGCDTYAKEPSTDGSDVGMFYNFLTQLDESIVAAAVENSVKWFGKKRSLEAIRDSFKASLSVSSDKVDGEYIPNGKYPPSFRAKVPVYDNRVSAEVVDSSLNPVYVTPANLQAVFPKGVEANLVISGSIYVIAGGPFGVTWRVQKAQVYPRSRVMAADIFTADEDGAVEADFETTETPAAETVRPATPIDQGVTEQVPAAPARKRRVAPAT